MSKALLLVDLQNDFFPGGALPTPEGDTIVEPVNQLISMAQRKEQPIFATRDWHPENHCSFEEEGGPWPPHCIRGTEGAAFNREVDLPEDAEVISKAQSPERDAYSGFEGTDLAARLKEADASAIVVGGLATDICVKNTVLDALEEGFDVTVVREAISGVEAEPGDSREAVREMAEQGARILSIEEVTL